MTTATQINQAMALQKPLEDYVHFLERLNARSLKLLVNLAVPGMHYTDPFCDVHGVDEVIKAFDQRLQREGIVKTRVSDIAFGRHTAMIYLRWQSKVADIENEYIEGMSEIMFSNDGLVMMHKDYYVPFLRVPKKKSLFGFIAGFKGVSPKE